MDFLGESTYIFRDNRSDFQILFLMKSLEANRIAPDRMPHFAALHLGLYCLLLSHKQKARLILVNINMHTSSDFDMAEKITFFFIKSKF